MNLNDATQETNSEYERILKSFGTKLPNVRKWVYMYGIMELKYSCEDSTCNNISYVNYIE